MRKLQNHIAAAILLVKPLGTDVVPLAEALGRVLREDVVSARKSPPFANSAMDGYALRAADAVAPLRVIGESAAGRAFNGELGRGEAVRIMTGAPVPAGADAVAPVEVSFEHDGRVSIAELPAVGAHIRKAGEDAAAGEVVVAAGVRLRPTHIGAIAACGLARVAVSRPVRVAIAATGDELVPPGQQARDAQIYDSNSAALAALASAAGATVTVLPIIRDDEAAVIAALSSVNADLIVTSGGVSAGAYDVVKSALSGLGVEFVSVAMQPGKPQGLGAIGGTPIVCLPGNPVSVVASFVAIVRPMLRRFTGETPPGHRTAVVDSAWASPHGRTQFMPVRLLPGHMVKPATAGGSGSHLVASLASADAFAVVEDVVVAVDRGDIVTIMEIDR